MTAPIDERADAPCVARVPIFAGLSRADQARVAALARPTTHAPGARVDGGQGAEPRLFVVHSGHVRRVRLAADGTEQLLDVLGPGDFAGETAVLTGMAPAEVAVAVDRVEVCEFRHHDLGTLLMAHPDVALKLITEMGRRLSDTEDRLHALASRDVASRLAGYLLGLPAEWAQGRPRVRLPLPKKDVAALLDTTPESLSRAFGRLEASGVLSVEGSVVTISDPDALERLAAG